MRFISKYGRLIVQIKPHIEEAYATGHTRVLQQAVSADFYPAREGGDMRPHERELALASWNFNGTYQELDEATIVPPDHRIGIFDSERKAVDRGWTKEIREEVERKLIDMSERFEHIIVAPRASVPPPWPRYDEYGGSVTSLVTKVVEEGYDLETVLTYEREMQNRPKVVDALERALVSGAEVEEGEVVIG